MPPKTKSKPADPVEEDQDEPATPAAPAAPGVEMVRFSFRGATFEVPKEMDEWDTEACIAIGTDHYMLAAKILLGPAQWALLQTLGARRKDTNEFLAVFAVVVNRECVD